MKITPEQQLQMEPV